MLYSPTKYRVHKHKHMLNKIVNAMLGRSGATTIYKVRAHIGVVGNELADTAAKIAAKTQDGGDITGGETALAAALAATPGGHPSPAKAATLRPFEDALARQPGLASSWLH